MFSRIEAGEKIKQDLTFCSMADNLNIGLEFYRSTGKVGDRTKKLLESGIELFKLLENDPRIFEESGEVREDRLTAFELYNSLNISAKHIEKLSLPEDTPQKASEYRKLIEDLKDKGIEIPPDKIEEIQDFTDTIEVLLLHRAREGAEMLRSRKVMV